MKIIISDTTALILLAKTNNLNLLTNFIDRVYIPKAVVNEIQYKNDIVKVLIENSDFIVTKEVSNQKILSDTEAIALALELGLRLIIDEKTGRKIASQKGVKIIGLLGILEANFRLEFISYRELLYILADFKRVNYRLNPKLEKAFLDGLMGTSKKTNP